MATTLSSNKPTALTIKPVTNEPVQISATDSGTTTSAVTIQKRPILIDGGGSSSIIKKPLVITKDESDFIKMDLLKEDTAGTESITENAAGTESKSENTLAGNISDALTNFPGAQVPTWVPVNQPAATEQAENSDKTSGNKKKMLIAGGIAAGLLILFIVLRKKK